MIRPFRLTALLVLVAACADSTAPARSSGPYTPPPLPVATVPKAPGYPSPEREGVIYTEVGAPYDYPGSTQFHGGIPTSRFVFYDDGRFGLQFSSPRFGFFEYGGTYARAGSQITFGWDGSSIAGPWGATGTLRGDTLHVSYNAIMQLSDFIDGDYVRTPATP